MTYVGNDISGAAAAYNNAQESMQDRRERAFQEALTRNFQMKMAKADAQRQSQQFQQEMGLRQQQLRQNAIANATQRERWIGQLGLEKQQLEDNEKNQAQGGLSPSQKTSYDISTAQQDAQNGFPDAPKGDVIDSDWVKSNYHINDDDIAKNLAETGTNARKGITGEYGEEGEVSNAGNILPRWRGDLAAATQPQPQPKPSSGLGWLNPLTYLGVGPISRWAGSIGVPSVDTSWVNPQQARTDALAAAVAAAQKGGQVVQNPISGRFSPAMARPSFVPAPTVPTAGLPVTPLPASQNRSLTNAMPFSLTTNMGDNAPPVTASSPIKITNPKDISTLRAQAYLAIRNGTDPDAVATRFKQATGQDLD